MDDTSGRTVMPAVTDSPIACSLTPAELGGRLREFDSLFAAHLTSVDRAPERLELTLEGRGLDTVGVRDLFERERACCPFFEFDIRDEGARLTVGIRAPEGAGASLDEFVIMTESTEPAVTR